MEAARLGRYLDKLAHAEERAANYEAWRAEAGRDLRSRLAGYKALQEAAEALTDVAAMLVLDAGRAPKDDATNLSLLGDLGIVSRASAAALVEFNGLRNRLVHEYDRLDDARAAASAARLVPLLRGAIEEVRAWISKRG